MRRSIAIDVLCVVLVMTATACRTVVRPGHSGEASWVVPEGPRDADVGRDLVVVFDSHVPDRERAIVATRISEIDPHRRIVVLAQDAPEILSSETGGEKEELRSLGISRVFVVRHLAWMSRKHSTSKAIAAMLGEPERKTPTEDATGAANAIEIPTLEFEGRLIYAGVGTKSHEVRAEWSVLDALPRAQVYRVNQDVGIDYARYQVLKVVIEYARLQALEQPKWWPWSRAVLEREAAVKIARALVE